MRCVNDASPCERPMPLMNIFEPLFLLLVLVTIVTALTAAVLAVAGRGHRAGRLLKRLGAGLAVYMLVVIAATAVLPRREYRLGENQCFDDWCIAVVDAHRATPPTGSSYEVSLRLSNRGKRRPMGEKGTVAYLVDEQGRRYDARADAGTVPFDTILQPGTSAISRIRFDAPGTGTLGLVYTHEHGFPIGWFIISEGGWFSKPPIMRLE
jgi:hypothetical protein